MQKTTFRISKMDCPSEEHMIRMKLSDMQTIASMHFNIPKRVLTVFHHGDFHDIISRLNSLNLDTNLIESVGSDEFIPERIDTSQEKQLLWKVLLINFLFFVVEIGTGYFSHSMGLVGDGLDMLADSLVYGMALYALGGPQKRKKTIAKVAGYFQLLLALLGFMEVIRRFIADERMPAFQTMIIISILALIGNAMCLYLLQKSKSKEAHMQASMIFTSNDVVINIGVICAATLVYITNSAYPDLFVGSVVFALVIIGAVRILKLAR